MLLLHIFTVSMAVDCVSLFPLRLYVFTSTLSLLLLIICLCLLGSYIWTTFLLLLLLFVSISLIHNLLVTFARLLSLLLLIFLSASFAHLLCLCCFWSNVCAFSSATFEQLLCVYYCFYFICMFLHLLCLYYCWLSVFASITFVRFCLYYCWFLSLLQLRLSVSVYITAGCLSLLSATFAHLLSFNWSPRIYRFLFLQPSSHFVWLTINLLELASSLTDDIFSACFTTSLALSLSHSHTNTIHSQLTNHRWGASSVIAFKSTHKSIRLTTYRNTSTM